MRATELLMLPDYPRRACRDAPRLSFFPAEDEDWRHAKPRLKWTAQRYCADCPIRAACESAGAAEGFGLWGGVAYTHYGDRRVRGHNLWSADA